MLKVRIRAACKLLPKMPAVPFWVQTVCLQCFLQTAPEWTAGWVPRVISVLDVRPHLVFCGVLHLQPPRHTTIVVHSAYQLQLDLGRVSAAVVNVAWVKLWVYREGGTPTRPRYLMSFWRMHEEFLNSWRKSVPSFWVLPFAASRIKAVMWDMFSTTSCRLLLTGWAVWDTCYGQCAPSWIAVFNMGSDPPIVCPNTTSSPLLNVNPWSTAGKNYM